MLKNELGPVFANLFQQSIDTCQILNEWSLESIHLSFFKKNDRALPCNYQPVSLTCVPYKMHELAYLCPNIMAHLDEPKLLSDRQYTFRKRHSCKTKLVTVIND